MKADADSRQCYRNLSVEGVFGRIEPVLTDGAEHVELKGILEGFCLTMASGLAGLLVAVLLCTAVNVLAPLPIRFAGMIITWQTGVLALAALVLIGVATSTVPARRAALLPPTEALRYEM